MVTSDKDFERLGTALRSFGSEGAATLAREGIGQPHTSQEARRVRHPRK